jgi:hypothetical protein
MEDGLTVSIQNGSEDIALKIIAEDSSTETLFFIDDLEALENGEAQIQLIEGHFYEYHVSGNHILQASEIVAPSKLNPSSGRLTPNVYTGTVLVNVLEPQRKRKCAEFKIEIRSKRQATDRITG